MGQVVVSSGSEKKLRTQVQMGQHAIIADAPAEVGGEGAGPNPHDLLLASLGACTSMTLHIFAGKRQWDLKTVNVKLEEQSVDDPANPGKKMTKIVREIEVEGNLTQEQLDSLKSIADKCPIHKLVVGQTAVSTELHVASRV